MARSPEALSSSWLSRALSKTVTVVGVKSIGTGTHPVHNRPATRTHEFCSIGQVRIQCRKRGVYVAELVLTVL